MTKRAAVVLLIDDDPALGQATIDILAARGHSALLALSNEDAFHLLTAANRIDVLILDLQMGAARGESLIEDLHRAGQKVPAVIVHSAQPMPELVRAAKTVGAEVVLQKPCSAQRLMEAIELATA
jgi:DNA-binding NtrC family response regulator